MLIRYELVEDGGEIFSRASSASCGVYDIAHPRVGNVGVILARNSG